MYTCERKRDGERYGEKPCSERTQEFGRGLDVEMLNVVDKASLTEKVTSEQRSDTGEGGN